MAGGAPTIGGVGEGSFLVLAVTGIAVAGTIGIHYELFGVYTALAPRLPGLRRLRVAGAVLVALCAHLLAVALFAVAISISVGVGAGALEPATLGARDLYYFSIVVYTSLGFGDIVPSGPLRLLIGVEAMTGLVMIAWTASFTFLEMQRFWDPRREAPPRAHSGGDAPNTRSTA